MIMTIRNSLLHYVTFIVPILNNVRILARILTRILTKILITSLIHCQLVIVKAGQLKPLKPYFRLFCYGPIYGNFEKRSKENQSEGLTE